MIGCSNKDLEGNDRSIIEIVFQYLSGGAEETDGKPQSEDWISWLDFN
jgi:hypothetical protein